MQRRPNAVATTWKAVRAGVARELRTKGDAVVAAWEQATGAARDSLTASYAGIVDELAGGVSSQVVVRVRPPRGVDVVAADYGWVRHALRDELFALVPPTVLRDALAALDPAVDLWTGPAIAAGQRDLHE